MTWPTFWKCIHMYLKRNIYNREKMYIVNVHVQVYRIHVCFRIILIFFQLGKLLTPTLKNIQNPEYCKTLVTRSWAGAAPGALEAVGRSPSAQRESALAAPRSRESERTFWGWLDDLRIGVDYPGGDHLGRVSGAGLSVRDVSRSRLSLVLRSLVRKSTTTSYFEQKKDKKLDSSWLAGPNPMLRYFVPCWVVGWPYCCRPVGIMTQVKVKIVKW